MESRLMDLSTYRMQRAKEALEAAGLDFENHQYAASMNRSYYAVFHAIRAVNSLDGFDSKKHSGVIAYFNQTYLKTEKIRDGKKSLKL